MEGRPRVKRREKVLADVKICRTVTDDMEKVLNRWTKWTKTRVARNRRRNNAKSVNIERRRPREESNPQPPIGKRPGQEERECGRHVQGSKETEHWRAR